MQKAWSTYKPQTSAAAAYCGKNFTAPFCSRRNHYVADSLPGKRERFAPGIAYYCILVVINGERQIDSIVDQFPVRFIGYKENLCSKPVLRFLKLSGKLLQTFLGQNRTCRIVWRIYDYRRSVRVQCSCQCLKIRLKIFSSYRNLYGHTSRIFYEYLVFRKVWRKHYHLAALPAYRAQGNGQGCSRTRRHIEISRLAADTVSFVNIVAYSLSYFKITGSGSVTMELNITHLTENTIKIISHLRRTRHIWISQAEIKYLICPDFCLSFTAILKQFPYFRTVLAKFNHFFI